MNTAHKYIQTCSGIVSARSCSVILFGSTFEACHYHQKIPITEGCEAYRRGEREHVREMIYVVGQKPKEMKKAGLCYTVSGDAREWYLCGYIDEIAPEFAAFHPHGANFLLGPWEIEGKPNSKVDDYEPRPYKRFPLVINY